ncbi:hypothetical protein N9M16_08995, partial [Candidatus Dependentiae bacterium]|nr:hypothetical protein [Candidatus Dependentiae bacterium]
FSDDAPPQQNREIRDPHDADALADDLHDHLDIEGDVDGLLDDKISLHKTNGNGNGRRAATGGASQIIASFPRPNHN